ncbi:hypothetical protein Nepgr_007488 [Nepenthes gracilis]|uniref:E2 ubiquitin-conjugating enzyme n=1 Tax=Nepenthes gracilis TaxID=150966 RepID=A0AAD3S735_NEPGR|nr:hypothetical protein Nepgr_007488 [Nepenthes gracilis]
MEKPPLSRDTPLNSRKQVIKGTSSSSSTMDSDVIEIPAQVYSKCKALKQKEVIYHEIIDIEDEDIDDIMIIDKKASPKNEGKKPVPSFLTGRGAAAANGSQLIMSAPPLHNISDLEDFGSNSPLTEDKHVDMDLDVWFDDDFATLQEHFDSIDIPPGVEATIPWWPISAESKKQAVSANSSSYSTVQHLAHVGVPEYQHQSSQFDKPQQITKSASMHFHGKGKPVSLMTSSQAGFHVQTDGMILPSWTDTSQFQGSLTPSYGQQPASWTVYQNIPAATVSTSSMSDIPGIKGQIAYSSEISGVSPSFSGWKHISGGNVKSSTSHPAKMSLPALFTGSHFSYVHNPSVQLDDGIATEISVPSDFISIRQGETSESHILQKLKNFKKFDTVEDHSDHHYTNKKEFLKQPSKGWAKKIQEEWKILEKDLPDTIYVRAYETRMDLLRAVIVGAEGTPYHDGIFFFDVYFPSSYPNMPPQVYYHSGGLRLNPNLYNCGKVCLSLLNTWSGSANEKWIPQLSTMLQVLVSIQGLILNSKPYFNEPGYASTVGTIHGEMNSERYNETTFLLSLKTMLYMMRRPPKHFEDFVFGHFFMHAHDILVACEAYLNGAQVGTLVKGGVQSVDIGDKSCSESFKLNLPSYINALVQAFSKIGVKDCEKYRRQPEQH